MELARTVASLAVVLGIILAMGHAFGDDAADGASAPKPTVVPKTADREAARRAAVQEQERRKAEFARACNKPLKSDAEMSQCREAYRRLEGGSL